MKEREGDIWISTEDLADLIDPIIRPSYSGNNAKFSTVIIDPMQGESVESPEVGDETLALALELEKIFASQGIKARLTRRDETNVTNRIRRAIIDAEPEAVYIALGINSESNGEPGVSSVALVQPGSYSERAANAENRDPILDKLSISLAVALHSHAMSSLDVEDLGVSRVEVEAFSEFSLPTAMVELPPLPLLRENIGDTELETRRVAAAGIVLGFLKFRDATQKSPDTLPEA